MVFDFSKANRQYLARQIPKATLVHSLGKKLLRTETKEFC